MPSVNLTVKWPNGELSSFYSPSTIIYEFFKTGEKYQPQDFLNQADKAFNAASERVRARYGFACSSAMDTLNKIRFQAQSLLLKQEDTVEIIDLYNLD